MVGTHKCSSAERSSRLMIQDGSVYPTSHLCAVLHFLIFLKILLFLSLKLRTDLVWERICGSCLVLHLRFSMYEPFWFISGATPAAPMFQYVWAVQVHLWCYTCCTYVSVCMRCSGSSLVLHLLHLCFSMYELFRYISGATPAAPMFQYVRAVQAHLWYYTCCTCVSVCTSRSGSSLVLHLLVYVSVCTSRSGTWRRDAAAGSEPWRRRTRRKWRWASSGSRGTPCCAS